jgi:hypothetical protein
MLLLVFVRAVPAPLGPCWDDTIHHPLTAPLSFKMVYAAMPLLFSNAKVKLRTSAAAAAAAFGPSPPLLSPNVRGGPPIFGFWIVTLLGTDAFVTGAGADPSVRPCPSKLLDCLPQRLPIDYVARGIMMSECEGRGLVTRGVVSVAVSLELVGARVQRGLRRDVSLVAGKAHRVRLAPSTWLSGTGCGFLREADV